MYLLENINCIIHFAHLKEWKSTTHFDFKTFYRSMEQLSIVSNRLSTIDGTASPHHHVPILRGKNLQLTTLVTKYIKSPVIFTSPEDILCPNNSI
jgi:hypothetical protein